MDYQLDPPMAFDVPFNELARFVPFLQDDWGWQRMTNLMPRLLAEGHGGEFAVVEIGIEEVAVFGSRFEALMECQRRGGPGRARYYLIAERHPVGRTYARFQPCPDTSSSSPRVAS